MLKNGLGIRIDFHKLNKWMKLKCNNQAFLKIIIENKHTFGKRSLQFVVYNYVNILFTS